LTPLGRAVRRGLASSRPRKLAGRFAPLGLDRLLQSKHGFRTVARLRFGGLGDPADGSRIKQKVRGNRQPSRAVREHNPSLDAKRCAAADLANRAAAHIDLRQ
jgi:hypothetical protein